MSHQHQEVSLVALWLKTWAGITRPSVRKARYIFWDFCLGQYDNQAFRLCKGIQLIAINWIIFWGGAFTFICWTPFFELTRLVPLEEMCRSSRGTINTGHGCFGVFPLAWCDTNKKPYSEKRYSELPSFERFQDPTIYLQQEKDPETPIFIAAPIMRHGSPRAAAFRRRGRRGGGLRSNGATPTTAAATAADGGRFAQALATHQALQSCRSWGSRDGKDGSHEVREYIAIKMTMVFSSLEYFSDCHLLSRFVDVWWCPTTQRNPCHVYCWPTGISTDPPGPTYGWTWSRGTLWRRTRKLLIVRLYVNCIIVLVGLSWEILVFRDVPGWWSSK